METKAPEVKKEEKKPPVAPPPPPVDIDALLLALLGPNTKPC